MRPVNYSSGECSVSTGKFGSGTGLWLTGEGADPVCVLCMAVPSAVSQSSNLCSIVGAWSGSGAVVLAPFGGIGLFEPVLEDGASADSCDSGSRVGVPWGWSMACAEYVLAELEGVV